jgi:hypothetical protein
MLRGKSPITPGLITIQPSPYFTAMAELSAISFQQDLTTVSDDWGAHVHDTGQYISILMFHHASRLHPNLTKEQLWEFVRDNYEGAMGAQSHLPHLQAILMGKCLSRISVKRGSYP